MNPDPKSVSVINAEELVRRIETAKQLRAEGRPDDEIKAVEPSEDEMRAILLELRQDRSQINTSTGQRKKKQPKTLGGLLDSPL